MHFRYLASIALCAVFLFSGPAATLAQQQTGGSQQSDATPAQRLDVLRSRLDGMRRSLNSAIASMNAKDSGEKASPDDPRTRLRGLEQEASAILNEVNNLRTKLDRSERIETSDLERLEASATDLDGRVQTGLRETASMRSTTAGTSTAAASNSNNKKKKKGGFFSRIMGRGGDDEKYAELTGTVAPGRDRELFDIATREVRKGNYDTGRILYNTIITTYPDSAFLRLSKLAIADSFYLEGTTSALIQAGAAYQDWLTFFPTDPLSDRVMLKVAESEMRQMGLPDRDVSRARKAEQRLKALLQQFPNTSLRTDVQLRLNQVQENLAMHNLIVARLYYDRNTQQKGGLKGAQSRFREILEKYPNFSYTDEVLFKQGNLYVQEEEPDEAAKYYQQLVRDWPNSPFADKAREQLEKLGASIPDPDPIRAKIPQPERPGMLTNLVTQVVGNADVTVDRNGVIISKDNEGNDLIDRALANNGEIPSNVMPKAPVERRAPARPTVTPTAPKPVTQQTPAGTSGGSNSSGGVTITPTPPGRPNDGSNPAAPTTTTTTPQTVPATTAPTGTKP
jgi:outer membrane protein assembly factor BamD